jgi:hypothetical protein
MSGLDVHVEYLTGLAGVILTAKKMVSKGRNMVIEIVAWR